MQEAGEIVGAIGQQFPAPEPDEEIEIFALDALGIRSLPRRRRAQHAPARAESHRRARRRARSSSACVGRAREQRGEQRIFLRARSIDVVDVTARARMLADRDRDATRRGSTPVADSTAMTRSAGMRDQFETDGWEMPNLRASSLTPPAARIASSSPVIPHSEALFRVILIRRLRLRRQPQLGSIVKVMSARMTALIYELRGQCAAVRTSCSAALKPRASAST